MSVRVDVWLWAVRLFKTRSAAKQACLTGKVRVHGELAKPAKRVTPGDVVLAKRKHSSVEVKVVTAQGKRVGAELASQCYEMISLSEKVRPRTPKNLHPVSGERDPGTGRPTKKERRQLDRLRGRKGR